MDQGEPRITLNRHFVLYVTTATLTPCLPVYLLQSMEKGGNKKANEEWEYHLPSTFKKLPSSSPAIEHFIRDKYAGCHLLLALALVCSLNDEAVVPFSSSPTLR